MISLLCTVAVLLLSYSPEVAAEEGCWNLEADLSALPLQTEVPYSASDTITIGTYNALFLFDGERDRIDIWGSKEEAAAHLETIADVIRQDSPHILGLQEVEDASILEDLVKEIGEPTYNFSFVQGRDTFTGQDVGLLTRPELSPKYTSRTDCRATWLEGTTCRPAPASQRSATTGVSKNMIALFDDRVFGKKFAMIVVHFYAIPNGYSSCYRREIQAKVIQQAILPLINASFEVIVLGDINDFSDKYADSSDEEPMSKVLAMLRDPDGDGTDELFNVMEFIPLEERYTGWYDRDGNDVYAGIEETSQIDHILLTSGLRERVKRAWINHSYNPETVSDHWPLYVELYTNKGPVT